MLTLEIKIIVSFSIFLQNHKGYKWPVLGVENILHNPLSTDINHHSHIDDGKFKVDYDHIDQAERIINDSAALKEKCGKKSSQSVIRISIEALKIIETHDNFNFPELLSKMTPTKYEQIISSSRKPSEVALKFLDVYNSKKRKNMIFAHVDAHGKFIFEN